MPTANKPTKWLSPAPKHCDLCHQPITNDFIDGATVFGPWAIMCLDCHPENGRGLGLGRGQHYQKQGDSFVKVGE